MRGTVSETESTQAGALELLAAGAVGIRFVDGWRCRALVRDDRSILTVVYDGRWRCSCQGAAPDCAHIAATASVVRVL